MTLLVVASPCALVISIPATIVSAVANGARNGVLFKGGAALDALADVRVFALDKTGTMTRGTPRLTAILPLAAPRPALSLAAAGLGSQHALEPSTEADDPERELLRWAAAAELKSEHHLAKAVVASARERGLDVTEPPAFQSYPGRGVRAFLEGREILVGKPEWIEEETDTEIPAHARRWAVQQQRLAATLVFVAADGQCTGVLALCDQPRPGVRATLAELRRSGVERTVMLTGDDAATARVVADQVGISEVVSSLLPEEKAAGIAKLRERFGPVAMVGDGVNDAPALATADVGVALGAAGTDVALDTADVVIMGDDLNSLVVARRLAVRARRIVRQNLVIASGVLLTLVTLALLGRIGLTLGVLGHEGSTIVVVLNGLRLLGNRG
jgi:Cd2+/Zn2+-exporting ATPase